MWKEILLLNSNLMKPLEKSESLQTYRHSALDAESNVYNKPGIPAFAGMTALRGNDIHFFKGFLLKFLLNAKSCKQKI